MYAVRNRFSMINYSQPGLSSPGAGSKYLQGILIRRSPSKLVVFLLKMQECFHPKSAGFESVSVLCGKTQ